MSEQPKASPPVQRAIELLAAGLDYQDAGQILGVTRERMRQIDEKFADRIAAERADIKRKAAAFITPQEAAQRIMDIIEPPKAETVTIEPSDMMREAIAEAMGAEPPRTPSADSLTRIATKLACALGDLAAVAWELGEAFKREANHAQD